MSYFICGFVFIFSVASMAQYKFGAVSTATAQSGRAAVSPGDSSLLNPAAIVHLKGHHLVIGGEQGSPENGTKTETYNFSVTDNGVDSAVPASFYYSQGNYADPLNGDRSEKYFHLAFSNILFEPFSLGIALHHLEQRFQEAGFNQNNLDIGTLLAPFENFGVGMVFYNLLSNEAVVPAPLKEKSYQALAFHYIFHSFLRTRLDFVAKGSQLGTSLGIESFMNRFIVVRLGYGQTLETRTPILGAGLGFQGPKFDLSYAYQNLASDQKGTTHMVDFVFGF